MEKCAKLLLNEQGQITRIINEISCSPKTVVEYPNWFIITGIIVLVGVTTFFLWSTIGYPIWNVWSSKKRGEAELEEANFAEQVAIANANARFGAAEKNKEAELIEAQAVSKSIEIIGDSLEKNPSYNVWQWIKMMEKDNNKSTVYVPTEANLPILEAMRMKDKK